MIDESDITECRRKQLERVAKVLHIHRFASVHIIEEGIVVVLENNQKLFFKNNESEIANPNN